MATEIFRLIGSIFVDNEEANKSLSKTDEQAQGIGNTLANGIKTAGKWAVGIGTAAAAGATALYGVATKSAQAADEIDKMSQKIGISRESYQELDFILSQNGMDVNTLQSGMKKLVNTMSDVQAGSKTATAAFEALGVSATDSSGALRDQEDVFYDAITALQNMENETERNAIANDLFGKSASELAPLLNAGAGSMEELRQKAHELGIVLDDETIDAGVKFTDTVDQVKRSFEAVVTQIGAKVMPIIQQLLEWVIAHMPEIQKIMEVAFKAISAIVEAVGKAISWLAGIFEKHMPEIKEFVQKAFEGIKSLWENELQPMFKALMDFIVNVLAPTFEKVFNGVILPVIKLVFHTVKDLWNNTLKPVFQGIIDFLTGVFTGNWKQAFEGLKNIVSGVFNGMISVVKVPINAIIGIINGFISGLNRIRIPSWIPAIGGASVNISTIPYLAKGGVLEKGQTGYLEGTGAEAVVPLENNRKWISAVANDMESAGVGGGKTTELLAAILDALEDIGNAGIYLDSNKLVGALAGPMDKKLGMIAAQKARA